MLVEVEVGGRFLVEVEGGVGRSLCWFKADELEVVAGDTRLGLSWWLGRGCLCLAAEGPSRVDFGSEFCVDAGFEVDTVRLKLMVSSWELIGVV